MGFGMANSIGRQWHCGSLTVSVHLILAVAEGLDGVKALQF
jgi:hypothetical protein